MIAPMVNGYPSAVIHRGIAGDQRFVGEGQRLSWIDPSLRNRQIRGLQLSEDLLRWLRVGPASARCDRLAADDEPLWGSSAQRQRARPSL